MAVTLYVWRKGAQHIGHASLHIGDVYVSFWPEDAAGKKDVTLKQSHRAAFMETLEEDIINEGNRQPQALRIEHLDEAAMLRTFVDLGAAECRYNVLRMNCSSFAAALLEAGSGRPPSFQPTVDPLDYLGSGQGTRKLTQALMLRYRSTAIWTPEQLWLYATELRSSPPR
jgi:hypothetical protein